MDQACPTLLSVGQEWATLRSVGHFGPHYSVHTCPTLGFAVFNGVSERFQNLITTLGSVGREWSTLRSVGHFGPHYLVHTCSTLGFAVKSREIFGNLGPEMELNL